MILLATFVLAQVPQQCEAKWYKDAVFSREKRIHIGTASVHGLGVGHSNADKLAAAAEKEGLPTSHKYCVFYFNDGNKEAEQKFNWNYLERPSKYKLTELWDGFGVKAMNSIYEIEQCMRDFNGAYLGCDGMRHRGPTVFAMLLARNGCTPEQSVKVVEDLWGTAIKHEYRLLLATEAQKQP